MKPPYTALDDAAAIQFELEADDQEHARIITLGLPVCGLEFFSSNRGYG